MNKFADEKLKVLVLEPYFGGSHSSFLKGMRNCLPYEFTFMTLPARKWKWRMRLSAPYFADRLKQSGDRYDRILCSTFVDVATFRGLAPRWVRKVPLLTYFHENQFAYPVQVEDERDFHFALTNVTTALASDRIAFNSEYNFKTFIIGVRKLLKKSYDIKFKDLVKDIKSKTTIIYPGIDFSHIDKLSVPERKGPSVIIWNHRWEHDKNPDLFFRTLIDLDSKRIDFRLIVLGESFKDHPSVFEKAKKVLAKKILHIGYVNLKSEYAGWLRQGDIVVSTADHEFFGMSVIESLRAGCRPLLPSRLSYPELFPKKFLYTDINFKKSLRELITNPVRPDSIEVEKLTRPYSWDVLAPRYKAWIADSVCLF